MLTGEATDHLDPAAGLAEGAFNEVGMPDALPVLAREPQVNRQRVAVGEQTAHRRRVGVAPALGERANASMRCWVMVTASSPGATLSGRSKMAQ